MAENIKEFRDRLFDKAKKAGFSQYEIYYMAEEAFSVRVFKGEVQEYKNASSAGLSFRGKMNGKMGYAFTESIEDENGGMTDFLVKSAAENAGIIEEEGETLYPGDGEYPTVEAYSPAIHTMTVEEKISAAKAVEKAAMAYDPRVVSVDYNMLSTGEAEIYIANSLGLDVSSRSSYAYAYAQVRAEESGVPKTGFELFSGTDLTGFDPAVLGKASAEKAMELLGGKSVETGKRKVIFKNTISGDLLTAFVPSFFGENVQKGFSMLKDKLGAKVASDSVTLRDDALLPHRLGSCAFDSEGVVAGNKAVIERGILKTYLHNLKSAAKDGVKSTGNGFKSSYKASVGTSGTNFYIQPGTVSFDELLKKMGDGLVIMDLAGLHSGANQISGDFSLSAEGFLVEGGKITRPVEQITVAGNFFQMLNNVEAVAEDLSFSLPGGAGNVGAPSFLAGELDISGL